MVTTGSWLSAKHVLRCFLMKADWGSREKLHTMNRPFVCEICTEEDPPGRTPKNPHGIIRPVVGSCVENHLSDLKKHKRVHRNKGQSVCHKCDSAFKHKSHLKDHERRHRGDSPLRQSICQGIWSEEAPGRYAQREVDGRPQCRQERDRTGAGTFMVAECSSSRNSL